jgi:hypothetical protein
MTLVGLIKQVAGVEQGMMALAVTDRSAALTLGNGKPPASAHAGRPAR